MTRPAAIFGAVCLGFVGLFIVVYTTLRGRWLLTPDLHWYWLTFIVLGLAMLIVSSVLVVAIASDKRKN